MGQGLEHQPRLSLRLGRGQTVPPLPGSSLNCLLQTCDDLSMVQTGLWVSLLSYGRSFLRSATSLDSYRNRKTMTRYVHRGWTRARPGGPWLHPQTGSAPSTRCYFYFFNYLFGYVGLSCGISEKAMATHSSTLAWKIPWMEEPGRLQSMGLLRVGHD